MQKPQEDSNYRMLCDRIAALENEIKNSRILNTEEHNTILQNARETNALAEKIDHIIDTWTNFWSVIMGIRNIFFTVGFLYILASFIINWGDAVATISGG